MLALQAEEVADLLEQAEALVERGLEVADIGAQRLAPVQQAVAGGLDVGDRLVVVRGGVGAAAQPNTCTLGYNNLRFDDEVTRNCLYRNFYDPYAREWQNGNSRWDVIDVVRAARSLRPEGIQWPVNEEGRRSLRLDQLSIANCITHESAHDALSDVFATIGIARLVKQAQPKLFQFLLQHRVKAKVLELLQLGSYKPIVHISGKYAAVNNCMAIVLPICKHPTNMNGVIVYDLSIDPEPKHPCA